jgi:predicted Zn-dependent peptidase
VAPNITVAAAGKFDWMNLLELVDGQCGNWSNGPVGRNEIRETPGSGVFQVIAKTKVNQEHVFMIASGPPAHSPLRYAAEVLALAIGDDSGSRLYWALVDPGLSDSADTSFHEYEGAGSFFTSFSCEPARTAENLAIVEKVLAEVQKNGITEAELQQAKSKLGSRVVRTGERPMGRMQAIGMTWTYLHEYRTVDDELAAFDAVNLKTVRELLDRYPVDRLTTLALGPLEKLQKAAAHRNGHR